MKRSMIFLLTVSLLMAFDTCAFAEEGDLAIQFIEKESKSVSLSLDDVQIGKTYTLDDYAKVTPIDGLFVDYFAQFNKDADYGDVGDAYQSNNMVYYQEKGLKGEWANGYRQASWNNSSLDAEFFWFQMDITNLTKKAKKYLEDASVKVIYDDDYEFIGWVRQANFNYNSAVYRYGSSTVGAPFAVLDPANEEQVDMMYTGHFIFGCTLPNYVVEDKKVPLRMEIKLGGNDITYHIRK